MSTPPIRFFVVEPGRVFIPPKGLMAGPGATALIFKAGDLVEMPAVKVDRFVRGRKAAGDIREISATEAAALKAAKAAAELAAKAPEATPPVEVAPAPPTVTASTRATVATVKE